jgi:hypothetical protein
MIAKRQAISASDKELLGNGAGEAETTRRIFGIHDRKIKAQAGLQARQMVQDSLPARLSDHISKKGYFHSESLCLDL